MIFPLLWTGCPQSQCNGLLPLAGRWPCAPEGQVIAAISPDEPNYAQAATLGPEALQFLGEIAAGDQAILSQKAVYLAGLIGSERGLEIVLRASQSAEPALRAVAAKSARNPPASSTLAILTSLIEDSDVSVAKMAIRSVADEHVPALRVRLESLSQDESNPLIQRVSRDVLQRIQR